MLVYDSASETQRVSRTAGVSGKYCYPSGGGSLFQGNSPGDVTNISHSSHGGILIHRNGGQNTWDPS